MARIRSLKIGFFQNDELAALPALDRLLFAGLWLIADRAGRLEDRPARIKAELLPYEAAFDCDAALGRLAGAGFIRRYAVDLTRLIQIASFLKHQKPHQNEAVSALPPESPETLSKSEESGNGSKPTETGDQHSGGLRSYVLGLGNGLGGGELEPIAPVAEIKAAMADEPDPIAAILAKEPFDRTQDENETLARHRGITLLPRGIRPSRQRTGADPGMRQHHGCPGHGTWVSCARGKCLPRKLYDQWTSQLTEEADPHSYIAAFVSAALSGVKGPIGDDDFDFWRAQWKAKHGSAIPDRKHGLMTEAHRALAILEGRS